MDAQIIPTQIKSKLPHMLSYPVGAKAISEALLDVPQFAELRLEFRFLKRRSHPGTVTVYPVIQASFMGPMRSFSAPKDSFFDRFLGWKVRVDAVPRPLRHLIQNKIVAEALPSIRSWFLANVHATEREGGHVLEFSFDELTGELTGEEHAGITWQTTTAD